MILYGSYDEKNLTRFKGLMNDPNYFSILQVIALCYFINKRSIKLHFKLLISLLIIISVLISGSKTGFITFCCYIIFKVIEWFFETEKNRSKIILVLIMLIVLPIVSGIVMKLVEYSMIIIPASERILPVFTNFGEAISGGGSIRIKTWKTALYIFAHSPIMGIGIGTYSDVAEILSGSQLIAHNTYLQLLVEWGLPLTLLFLFCWFCYS